MAEYLEDVIEEMSDVTIPNFPQDLFFQTFVNPFGPAMVLVSQMYFTANLEGTARDPMEQIEWLRAKTPYFSKLAKSIQQIRNKVAHGLFLEGILFKNFVNALIVFERKQTQAQSLVDILVERTVKILEIVTKTKNELPSKPIDTKPPEENRKELAFGIYEPGAPAESLIKGHVYWIEDVSKSPVRNLVKGKTFLFLGGKFHMKKVLFRSWAGTVFYGEIFSDTEKLGRKSISHTQLLLLLD